MNCTNFTEGVESLLDGLLPAAEGQALRAHAASCAACGDELRCAERFRVLLAAEGQSAMVAAADREAASAARAEAAAAPRTFRPAWFRFAAAAVVVAAFGAGVFLSRTAVPTAEQVATGSVELVRGERRILGAGRTVLADDPTALEVIDEANVRLRAGSAMFQVEHGKPFSVVTEQGTVEVRGTLFHVAQRANRSVSVGVSSGVVAFHPVKGGAVRTLTAGAALEVSADGALRLVSRDQLTAAEAQAEAQRKDLDALRDAVSKKDEEIAALQARLVTAQAAAPVAEDPADKWHDLGEATRNLLFDPAIETRARIAAIETFQKHASVLRELTNGATALEWPWHPAVIAQTADGFVDTLAPLVASADRARAASRIRAAATEAAAAMAASTTHAEVTAARLSLFHSITTALRDDLGSASAAHVARSSLALSEFAAIRAGDDGDVLRKQLTDIWLRRLDLAEEHRNSLSEPIDRWITASKPVQASILGAWGEEAGRAFLFPEPQKGWSPKSQATGDDDQIVATSLRRLEAKIRLLAPRIEFERTMLSRVGPELAARARREMATEIRPTIWTFR